MSAIVILISGRGSNMEAILRARTSAYQVVAVIANNPTAGGLETATLAGIPTAVVDHKSFTSREAFDHALCQAVQSFQPDWVILAGFMRILSAPFIDAFPNRIVNIHPSLLPAFPGLHTHQRALDAGVKIHGATVHLVTPGLDDGPIIAQAAVPVLTGDTTQSLSERVLKQEHLLYPTVISELVAGRIELVRDAGGKVVRMVPSGVNSGTATTRADATLRAPWT